MILSAVYMLWMFQRVFYGEVTNEHNRRLPDLSFREWAIVGPLAAVAIYMGVFPNVFLKPMEPAVNRIVAARASSTNRCRLTPCAARCRSRAPRHRAGTCQHRRHLSPHLSAPVGGGRR